MKRKNRRKLLVGLAAAASLFILGGCSLGTSLNDVKEQNNLKAQVTYYANGGLFESNRNVKQMYFPVNTPAVPIGLKEIPNVEIERDGYDFEGWYRAVLDEEGKPQFEDEEKGLYKLGEKVSFDKNNLLQENDHWILVAKWTPKTKVLVHLALYDVARSGETADKTTKVKNLAGDKEYGFDDELIVYTYNDGEANDAPVELQGYTYVEYYKDEACSELVEWPVGEHVESTEVDTVIYAKYIKGDWTIVSTANQAATMMSKLGDETQKFYLLNDINATGKFAQVAVDLAATVYGNGHTVSGLTVKRAQNSALEKSASIFGNVQESAVMTDISFTDITYSIELQYFEVGNTGYKAHLVFTTLHSGADIENVVINVKKATLSHFSNDTFANNLETNWKFGGYDTDAAYEEGSQNEGFTVTGVTTVEETII